jgi:hypothetical protein
MLLKFMINGNLSIIGVVVQGLKYINVTRKLCSVWISSVSCE